LGDKILIKLNGWIDVGKLLPPIGAIIQVLMINTSILIINTIWKADVC